MRIQRVNEAMCGVNAFNYNKNYQSALEVIKANLSRQGQGWESLRISILLSY